jgi:hypothetical protein
VFFLLALAIAGPCAEPVTPDMAQTIFERLRTLPAGEGCALDTVDTERTSLRVQWRQGEHGLPPATLTFGACGGSRGWQIEAPPELVRACPTTLRGLAAAIEPVKAHDSAAAHRRWLHDGAALFFAGVLALVLVWSAAFLLRRGWRRDPRWLGLVLAAFALALAVRALVEPTMLTWYSDTLPPLGVATWERFGPGGYLYQELLRALLPWNDSTLFRANGALGALAVPLFVLVLRERRVPLVVAAACAVLFAFAPLHVRVSTSPREHVLASTATILLLFAWLRGHRLRDRLALAVALALIPVVALVRPDSWVQLVAVPLWTLLRDSEERDGSPRWLAALFWAIWAAVGVFVYIAVVVPSHHPRPQPLAQVSALEGTLPQYVYLAVRSPWWWSPVALIFALPGAVVIARRRPRLLAGIGIFLFCAFGLTGRTMEHDQLTGAHYFLTTIPMMLVLPAYGLLWLRERVRIPAWSALALLAIATLLPALPAYRYRYTFQDEYRFLRRALATLPDGCSVVQLPVRHLRFDRDPDCCLDVARSPLTLAYPRLRFVTLDSDDPDVPSQPDPGCTAFYRGAACSLKDTVEGRAHHAAAARYFAEQCALVEPPGANALAESPVSDHTADDLFAGRPPVVRLSR